MKEVWVDSVWNAPHRARRGGGGVVRTASPQGLNLEARRACTNRLGSNIESSSYIGLGVPRETVVVVGAAFED